MVVYFKSHEITIYRQRRKGSSNRFGFSATFTSYYADIQPSGIERVQMTDGRFGSVHTAFVEQSVDIQEGDQVVADDKRYSVKGISTWQGAGLLDHKELILVSLDG